MAKNVRKLQIIAKFQKLLNMVQKITKFDKNVKHCKKMQKMGLKRPKNDKISEFCFHRFSGSKLPKKMVLAIFAWCLVPEICIFCHFEVKSTFLGLNSSRTKEITAKPMVLSYVGQFSKHWTTKNHWSVFFYTSEKPNFVTDFFQILPT